MTVQDYLGLITSEHSTQPNFLAVVSANVGIQVQVQDLLEDMIPLFDVDTAVGDQLDIIGQWVGVSRNVNIPISGIYFTWDSDDIFVGWDYGIWQPPDEPSQLVTLPDSSYRLLVQAKIAANSWDGTTETLYSIFDSIFPSTNIFIQDNCNMTYDFIVVGNGIVPIDSLTTALITEGYIPLKPEGIRVNYYVAADTNPIFGWDSDGPPNSRWIPHQDITDGDIELWMDGEDPTVNTIVNGGVGTWKDKSANGYTYSTPVGVNGPTVSTMGSGGSRALASDGTQYLVMNPAVKLLQTTDVFVIGFVAECDLFTAFPAYPGIFTDGDGVAQSQKLGFSNDNVNIGHYNDVFFGGSTGFADVRWDFSYVVGNTTAGMVYYDGTNSSAGWTGNFDNEPVATNTAGVFAASTGKGSIFSLNPPTLSNWTLTGKIGQIVIIKNPSTNDLKNLKSFLHKYQTGTPIPSIAGWDIGSWARQSSQ